MKDKERGKRHDYYGTLELNPEASKHKIMQRSTDHIPYMKTRGREDNLMYKISDGYNLETNDKTFWD